MSQECSLGYVFLPDPDGGSIGYAEFEVLLRAVPTGLHFDPSEVRLRIVMPDGRVQAAAIRHPSYSATDSGRVIAGRILLHDHYGKVVEAFSFGGEITVSTTDDLTTCHIISSAPIIELALDEPLPTLLVEEVEVLLAHQHAIYDQRGKDYEMHLAQIEPSLLYCACLAELHKKLLPASDVTSGNPEMPHLISFLPLEMTRLTAAGLCPKLIPSVAELL